jgi:hypothetical protein
MKKKTKSLKSQTRQEEQKLERKMNKRTKTLKKKRARKP